MDKQALKTNVSNLPKMLSAWFIAAMAALAAWWVGLEPAKQVEYLQLLPWKFPPEVYPTVLGLIGLVLRVVPQSSLHPPAETPTADDVPTQPAERTD